MNKNHFILIATCIVSCAFTASSGHAAEIVNPGFESGRVSGAGNPGFKVADPEDQARATFYEPTTEHKR